MKKNTIKRTVKNAVIGTVCTSLLASSCTKYNMKDNIYEKFAPNEEIGRGLSDLYETNLSDLFYREAGCVESIINELLNNPETVQKLLDNPDVFFQEREIGFRVELSSAQRQLLKAFADTEAVNAIKSNDVKEFIEICQKKGFINPQFYENVSLDDLRNYFRTDEDFDLFVENYQIDPNSKSLLLAIPVAALAIGLYIAGAITLVLYGTVVVVEVEVIGKDDIKRWFRGDGDDFDPCVRLWQDNDMPSIDQNTCMELIDRQATMFLEEIKGFIDYNYYDQAYNILRSQLIHYYECSRLFE